MGQDLSAVLFCRSVHNSAQSIAAQEDRCKRKAVAMGAGTTMTIFDAGSAKAGLNRPAVAELRSLLRSLLRSRLVDLVVADTPDRLTRDIRDIRTLGQEISRAGARLVFVSP